MGLADEEVGDVHSKGMRDQEKIAELWIPDRVFVPLDASALEAGAVGELLL